MREILSLLFAANRLPPAVLTAATDLDVSRKIFGGEQPSNAGVEIFGSCFEKADVVRSLAERGDSAALVSLTGSYSLAIRHGAATTLVGSAVGPSNLFYAHTGAGFFYGTNVVDLVKQARLAWRWNWAALADMTALEHCVDGETNHADVRKVEPGSVVRFDGASVSSWQMPWADRFNCERASPEGAVDALVGSCRRYIERDVVVSMSAGFDSRLLLACLLASGVKPRLITMGHADSTDVRVSAAIARRFSLRFDRVPLQASSYMEFGADIVRITGGAKSFQNWHTYAYAKNAPLTRESRVFIGSNGEAARSYYLDKGVAAIAAGMIAPMAAKRAFWTRKLRCIFRDDELALLHPHFAAQFGGSDFSGRLHRLRTLSPGPLLQGLDRFYTEQRVSTFIANGLSLVDAHTRIAAPMLDRQWLSHIWNLPRRWKMDSRWHRFAIARLCPLLLDFEEESTGRPMLPHSRSLYWLPRRRNREPTVPYMDYAHLMQSAEVLQFVHDARDRLEPIAKPELASLIFDRHKSGDNRTRAASFLLTMLFFTDCLRRQGIQTPAD